MGSWVRILRNQFGHIWSKLNPWVGPCLGTLACILVLQIMSSPFRFFLKIKIFWGLKQLIFPPKWCHIGLALICHFFWFWKPSSISHGSNLWLSSNRIALFHWTMDVGPSSKKRRHINACLLLIMNGR
jgi:hypothetical protein